MVGKWADWGGYIRSVRVQSETEQYASESAEETAAIAARLAARLSPGDVVLLRGELGSGKSVFVRGAAAALGFAGRVTSPTFAIGNVYSAAELEIAHLDLYRLDQLSLGDEAVLEDFLTPERIGFVEWPHAELGEATRLRAIVTLTHAGEDRREVKIEWIEDSQ